MKNFLKDNLGNLTLELRFRQYRNESKQEDDEDEQKTAEKFNPGRGMEVF
jgi:hypothetical protein